MAASSTDLEKQPSLSLSQKEGISSEPSPSSSSLDSNPLAPLEHALGDPITHADTEPPDEDDDEHENPPLNLTRTRTSITSSASRPPDFEVTLEHDDPENPRNW